MLAGSAETEFDTVASAIEHDARRHDGEYLPGRAVVANGPDGAQDDLAVRYRRGGDCGGQRECD